MSDQLSVMSSGYSTLIIHSVRKLFTGFAIAAFIAWKLTVINAINITNIPAEVNNHQLREMRYG